MQESLTKSVWAYAVESKGSSEEGMTDQICEDLETIGLKNERIVLKSDQEPSIVDVMKEIQKARERATSDLPWTTPEWAIRTPMAPSRAPSGVSKESPGH